MRRPLLALILAVVAAISVAEARERQVPPASPSDTPLADARPPAASGFALTRQETLWIFDADFSTLTGDNAGWMSFDRSETVGQENYWHHDTIRINGFEHLGDSTWWCGTSSNCWRQPRGYANGWVQILERSFPEIEANTNVGDDLTLDYDQRFAMEHDFDYGYTDISTDGGETWTTVHMVTNPGFAGKPGFPVDWDDPERGHVSIDLSAHAGLSVDLRFRFESDEWSGSSQDRFDEPPHSYRDGAWQLDNIAWSGSTGTFWLDGCESGNMGWIHDDVEPRGQTGVTFQRGQYGIDFVTGRGFLCDDRPIGTWVMAAVDPFTSTMVDGQHSWLLSPPIDISAAPHLVSVFDAWMDFPGNSGDRFTARVAATDLYDCTRYYEGFYGDLYESFGWWIPPQRWYTITTDFDVFAGNDWLASLWVVANWFPPMAGESHWGGVFFNRVRLGIPSGDPGTSWYQESWDAHHDWFQDDLDEALVDTARVRIGDPDEVVTVYIIASNDAGENWEAYECLRENPLSDWWKLPPPVNQMTPGSEIWFYYEATDGVGNTTVWPDGVYHQYWEMIPDDHFEMSILPFEASVSSPGILLVDANLRPAVGAERNYRQWINDYYREALEIQGYRYEPFEVETIATGGDWYRPDTTGLKYYDTVIWVTGYPSESPLTRRNQMNLVNWLSDSTDGKERNLLLAGENVGAYLIEGEQETLGFYGTWLATEFIESSVGEVTVDSIPGLENRAGGYTFLTHEDAECILQGGCPDPIGSFDVLDVWPGTVGAEVVLDYVRTDGMRRPAGVAYAHPTMGYQTVNLGFCLSRMMDGVVNGGAANYTPEGYFHTGITDRADLMQNIMEYFGKTPAEPGTSVVDGGAVNSLSQAYPNPFNPVTEIAYSVKDAGPVTIRIVNVAGKVVRTLLRSEVEAGTRGHVVWHGRNDAGERCASGVYFYRITAPGFVSTKKMILLR